MDAMTQQMTDTINMVIMALPCVAGLAIFLLVLGTRDCRR